MKTVTHVYYVFRNLQNRSCVFAKRIFNNRLMFVRFSENVLCGRINGHRFRAFQYRSITLLLDTRTDSVIAVRWTVRAGYGSKRFRTIVRTIMSRVRYNYPYTYVGCWVHRYIFFLFVCLFIVSWRSSGVVRFAHNGIARVLL